MHFHPDNRISSETYKLSLHLTFSNQTHTERKHTTTKHLKCCTLRNKHISPLERACLLKVCPVCFLVHLTTSPPQQAGPPLTIISALLRSLFAGSMPVLPFPTISGSRPLIVVWGESPSCHIIRLASYLRRWARAAQAPSLNGA